jgi:hypothetical protein
MENGRMPPFQTIVKSLSPTETLIVVPVRTKLAPLPICIATENDRARVVTLPYTSFGETLLQKVWTLSEVESLNPEWSVMLSHTTIIAKGC